MPQPNNLDTRIAEVIQLLQPGEVVSYGDIAADAGSPRAFRHVGRVLAVTEGLPWWRVVTSGGRLVPGNELKHAELLRAEGVVVAQARVQRSPAGRFAVRRR